MTIIRVGVCDGCGLTVQDIKHENELVIDYSWLRLRTGDGKMRHACMKCACDKAAIKRIRDDEANR